MWLPPHHYTYALSRYLDQSPDLTVLVRDGQVFCHKPVLACHSYFLKDVLLPTDTDVLALPDFGKEEITNLIQVLYGQVSEIAVSKQLLETLGIDVRKMQNNPGNLGRKQENEDFPMVEFQLSGNENRSIFDIDELEEENSYKCCNCSVILSSLSILCAHMETCGQTEDQEVIYQCSVCNLICSSLEDLGSHMDMHSNEEPVNQEVILGDMEEAVINADFVIADMSMDAETIAQEAINEEIREEIILEEIEDNNHLVVDEEVEIQDPSIETTEVTVGCDDAMENDFHSQKFNVSPKDIRNDISSREMTVPSENISDIKIDTKNIILKDFCHTSLETTVLNSTQENSNDFDVDKNSSEIKKVKSSSLYSCKLCSKAFSTEAVLLLHTRSAHKKINMNQNSLDVVRKSDRNEKSDFSTESLLSNTHSSHLRINVDPINLDLSAKSDQHERPSSPDFGTENKKINMNQNNLDVVRKSDRNEKPDLSTESLLSNTQSSHLRINVDLINLDLSAKSDQHERPISPDLGTENKKINMNQNNQDVARKSERNEKQDFSTETLLSTTQTSHQRINVDTINLDLSAKPDHNKPTIPDLSTESVSRDYTQIGHPKMNLDHMNLDLVSKSNGSLALSYLNSISVHSSTNHTESTNKNINVDRNNLDLTEEFVCHFCEHRFDSPHSLNEHTVTSHTEFLETGEMLNEDDILTKAIEMTDFNKIDEQVANQEASLIFSCTLCESSFSSTKALTQHVNSSHVIQPPNHMPVSCNYCDIHFITRSTLAKHYETAHPGHQPIFQCPQCGKALKTFKSLQRHEVRHTDVRPFQCGQCRAKFHWGEALRTHAKRGCKPSQRFSLPAPSQNASRPIPKETFSLSIPNENGILLSESTSLPITTSAVPNCNLVLSISFDSNTSSINMSCTNCFLKFASHQDYNSHICTKQSQTVRSNSDEIFSPAPTEQSLPPEMHINDGQKNFWNNPFSEVDKQLSDYREEHSNQGLESFENIVHQLNISVNKDEAVTSPTPNIGLKAPVISNSMVEGFLTHKYSCDDCQYDTNARKSFKKHLESQKHKENSSVKRYFCDQCDMAFGTLKFLDDHINRKHKIKKIKQRLLNLKESKRMKMEIEATQFEEIHDGNEIIGELISKSGRKIIPRMFADGDKVFTPLLNCLRKRTIPINESSNIESDSNSILEGIGMTNEKETEEIATTADTKKTDIDVIATQCELCQDFFVSRRRFFLHMLTHVPPVIRANLPEGQHGWCPHCPGPVPVEKINSHVADSHPEILASSRDVEFGDIPCDADLEKMLEDGFDLDEISQDELDMLDISEDRVISSQCPPAFVKIVPVDLDRYGINVMDYM